VNPGTDCERVRLRVMTELDGETVAEAADALTDTQQHLAACPSCRTWLKNFESMNSQFQRLTYPNAQVDLWLRVERRISRSQSVQPVTKRLWLIGAVMLAWRALQLLIDLPLPALHPFVPLAAAVIALWQIAGDPLAIETFAPELQKRGV
jgi:predicted anti-sigma-YlaC factor YlaD